jgi:S1-C subfamily serine protease/pSer/pThr/pTyr-binding forkhead associated (FHA) protein
MPLELRVLSGARAGHSQRFDKRIVAIGRHPKSDFQLEPVEDLDVSVRHAEIVASGGGYRIRDSGSTNGTFVNGRRIEGEEEIRHGDVLWLGAEGPKIEVSLPGTIDAALPPTAVRTSQERASTGERVQLAVRERTAWLRRVLVISLVLLGASIGVAYWMGQSSSREQVAELARLLAESESTTVVLQSQLQHVGDTTLLSALRQQNAEMADRVRATSGRATEEELAALQDELRRRHVIQRGLAAMDLAKISARNDAAIAFIATELDGRPYGGTAFGIGASGLLVTNKHNVVGASGKPPTRIAIKYANTSVFLHGRVVSVADGDIDLALVRVEEKGHYPVVARIAPSVDHVRTGAPVATIGFPLALDTPMDGNNVKTSLTAGTVSKIVPGLIQIDAYAGSGSSGSPVFDGEGRVIGVVWGGPSGGQGRLAYAVPSDRLIGLLPAEARALLR